MGVEVVRRATVSKGCGWKSHESGMGGGAMGIGVGEGVEGLRAGGQRSHGH